MTCFYNRVVLGIGGGNGLDQGLKGSVFPSTTWLYPCSWAKRTLIAKNASSNIIFYDKILLFIKMDPKLCPVNALPNGNHDYYLKTMSVVTTFKSSFPHEKPL